MQKKPTVLAILDGYGYRAETHYNAVAQANTPHLHAWWKTYPHALLRASGTAVGLPDGVIGNSEVGHLTIGAGRVIAQPTTRIGNAIDDGSFFTNPVLTDNLATLARSGNTLHLMGLLSDAQVHSHTDHLYALLRAAHNAGIKNIIVHAFLDGRDTPPQSAAHYLENLEQVMRTIPGALLGSLHGRLYAMDRDNNWQRTEKSYHVLTTVCTEIKHDWRSVLQRSYAQNIFDEYIVPIQLVPTAYIRNGDGIIFFNTRPDRARQLTACFVDSTFDHFPVKQYALTFFITPVRYSSSLPTTALFAAPPIAHTLKEVVSHAGKTILAIAETEKYAHVTYFFSGGKESAYPGETQMLIPSIKATSYADHPCMRAPEITDAVLQSLEKNPCDLYIINYANADMVGHSGNFQATCAALECLDTQLARLYDTVMRLDGTLYITADHGKVEEMYDTATQQPHTAHTANLVPFMMCKKDLQEKAHAIPLHELADIAPFVLKNMGLPVPEEMVRY